MSTAKRCSFVQNSIERGALIGGSVNSICRTISFPFVRMWFQQVCRFLASTRL
jgi:hypothetical protein